MKYHPLVTIVIPVYNGHNFVDQAIESALSQTYDNVEIMVINDGSGDNGKTKDAIMPYFDKIIYIEKANGGVSSVLNLAFKKMKGEWLSWLSHDDLYYPSKIQKQIDYINTYNITDYDKTVIFSDFDFIDEFGNDLRIMTKNQITPEMDSEELIITNIKRNSFGGCTFLIPKKAFYDIGGFSEHLRTISDYDYWYRLLFKGYRFHYIPEVLTSNRMHSQQVTYKASDLAREESIAFHKSVVEQLAVHKKYCKEKNFIRVAYYMECKGIKSVSQIAYNYALKYKNSNMVKMKILINKIIAKIYGSSRRAAKAIYIKSIIFRKTIRQKNKLRMER